MSIDQVSLPPKSLISSFSVKPSPMLTVEEASHIADGDADVMDLLRQFNEVNLQYAEVVASMRVPEPDVAPVMSSANVTISFNAGSVQQFQFSAVNAVR